jgi:hypothetical protein
MRPADRSPCERASGVSDVHDLAHDRREFGYIRRSFHVGGGRWVYSHGIEVRTTLPLRVVHHVSAIDASVDVCRDESRYVLHENIRGFHQHVHQFLLVLRVDQENIHQCHRGLICADCCNTHGNSLEVASDNWPVELMVV